MNFPLLMRKRSLHSDDCCIYVQEQIFIQDFELGGRGEKQDGSRMIVACESSGCVSVCAY